MINEYGGGGLERDLSRLDLGRDADPLPLLSTVPQHERRREPYLTLSGPDDMFSTTGDPPRMDLVSIKQTPSRDPAPSEGISRFRRNVAAGPSAELLGSIFNGIAKQTGGGRKFAQLDMDDSGRWRVARIADTDKILTGDDER